MKTTREVAVELGVSVARLDFLERRHMDPRVLQVGGRRVWRKRDVDRARAANERVRVMPQMGRGK